MNETISKLSKEVGLPVDVVKKVYSTYWLTVREYLSSLPLKELDDNISEEEFKKLRTSINIPSIGKLHCTYERFRRIKKHFEFIKELRRKKDEENDSKGHQAHV
jgi:Na+/phosphate symporter